MNAKLPATERSVTHSVRMLGRFRIESFLAEGAFGQVFKAYDPHLDRWVALKLAKENDATLSERGKRFLREARAAANLRHPNIVPVFEAGREETRLFIASALIQGESLADRLDQARQAGARLDRGVAVAFVRQLADALAYAHAQGVVHRDVKPGNVMIDERGDALLMDFGLASRLEDTEKLTRDNSLLGTPLYMSPEQAQSSQIGPASDQYSLGVLLYELLLGEAPFTGTPQLVIFHHQETEPPRPRRKDDAFPRDLETIVLKCLEKKPENRYPHCQALADDLRRWQEGEPIVARPLPGWERLARWMRKRPAVAALLTLLSLSVIVIISGGALYLSKLNSLNQDLSDALDRETAERMNAQAAVEKEKRALQKERASRERELKEKALSDRFHYIHNIRGAGNFLEERNFAAVSELLQSLREKTSSLGLEWHELMRRCEYRHAGQVFGAHAQRLTALQYSPNSKLLAAGDEGGTIRIYDAGLRVLVRDLKPASRGIRRLAFSPDGKMLAATSADRKVSLWDLQDGVVLASATTNSSDAPLLFAMDGKSLVVGSGRYVTLLSAPTLEQVKRFKHGSAVSALTFSFDGKEILVGGSEAGDLAVLDARALKLKRTLPASTESPCLHLAICANTGQVAGGFREKILVWDWASGKVVVDIPQLAPAKFVQFTPDGQSLIALTQDQFVRCLKFKNKHESVDLAEHEPLLGVREIALAQDGDTLALPDRTEGKILTISLREPDSPPEMRQVHTPGKLVSFDFRKGDFLTIQYGANALAFAPDEQTFVTAADDLTAVLWDAKTCTRLHTFGPHLGGVHSVAFSRDGEFLAAGDFSNRITIWEIRTKKRRQVLKGHGDRPIGLAFSFDGTRLFSASWDKTLRVWDTQRGALLATLEHPHKVRSMDISRDGRFLATHCEDTRLRVWDTHSMKIRHDIGDLSWGSSLRFSPDDAKLASSSFGGNVNLWNMRDARRLVQLPDRGGHSLAFSHDGRTLATVSDAHLKIIDLTTYIEIIRLPIPSEIRRLEFLKDGSLCALLRDGRFLRWPAPPQAPSQVVANDK